MRRLVGTSSVQELADKLGMGAEFDEVLTSLLQLKVVELVPSDGI